MKKYFLIAILIPIATLLNGCVAVTPVLSAKTAEDVLSGKRLQ